MNLIYLLIFYLVFYNVEIINRIPKKKKVTCYNLSKKLVQHIFISFSGGT